MLNMQRQQYEFVNCPGADFLVSFVIYHKNEDKCYHFTDTNELRSAFLLYSLLVVHLSYAKTHINMYLFMIVLMF